MTKAEKIFDKFCEGYITRHSMAFSRDRTKIIDNFFRDVVRLEMAYKPHEPITDKIIDEVKTDVKAIIENDRGNLLQVTEFIIQRFNKQTVKKFDCLPLFEYETEKNDTKNPNLTDTDKIAVARFLAFEDIEPSHEVMIPKGFNRFSVFIEADMRDISDGDERTKPIFSIEYSYQTKVINYRHLVDFLGISGGRALYHMGHTVYSDLLHFVQCYLVQELTNEQARAIKALQRNDRKKQVRKSRALHESEIYTATAVRGLEIFDRVQSPEQAKEISAYIERDEFLRLSNSYGFLTDAFLSYLDDYRKGNKQFVTIGKFVPEGNTDATFSEEIVIHDTFSNFCAMAGIVDTKQRMELYKEIKENKFAKRGMAFVRKEKNEYRFTLESFLSYKFTTKKFKQLKNLHNVRGTDAIDTITLRANKDIFSGALIDKKGSGTRGFTEYPERLERQLRDTVKAHSRELKAFCQGNKAVLKYIKGGDYTSTIRPLFNMLIQETGGNTRIIKGKEYLEVNKPIGTYARSVCEQAYHIEQKDNRPGREVFKKGKAIAHISYAMEVLKYFYQDGTENVNIYDYCFTDTHIVIHIDRTKKAKLDAPKGK